MDMNFEFCEDVKEEEYLEMICLKMVVLLVVSLKIGVILGGVFFEDVENLYDFGMQIGVVF